MQESRRQATQGLWCWRILHCKSTFTTLPLVTAQEKVLKRKKRNSDKLSLLQRDSNQNCFYPLCLDINLENVTTDSIVSGIKIGTVRWSTREIGAQKHNWNKLQNVQRVIETEYSAAFISSLYVKGRKKICEMTTQLGGTYFLSLVLSFFFQASIKLVDKVQILLINDGSRQNSLTPFHAIWVPTRKKCHRSDS